MSSVILDNCENLWAEQVTIAAGASEFEAVETQGRALIGIILPATTWTAARIGFKSSLDNRTYSNPIKDNANNLQQCIVVASDDIAIPATDPIYRPYLKLYSCDAAGAAVPQVDAKTITLLFRRYLS